MTAFPGEATWARVEGVVEKLGRLSPAAAALALNQLVREDESPTVIHLARTWLALPSVADELSAGQRIGGFALRRRIGEGGMGTVWLAEQAVFGREVALKMIHPALVTDRLVEIFEREVRILGRLEHPGIVRVYDAGFHVMADGRRIPFCAMELIRGRSLRAWAEQHRGDLQALLRVLIEVCLAVQRAHDGGIVHRDLKPENIMVTDDGKPVVLDFGIARLVEAGVQDVFTGFFGTPQYAAPEQHLGRDQDFRSGEGVDIYALGVVAFEMFAGRLPFVFHRGTPIAEMRRAILEDPVPTLGSVRPDVPDHLSEIVAKALRRNPADRYYSMAGLRRALGRSVQRMDGPPATEVSWRPVADVVVPGTLWRLRQRLGEGGAGEVWRAWHEELSVPRIFKFCESDEAARTLRREVTLFRLLRERIGRNPHFVQLHEVSLDEPPYYLIMEDDDAQDLEAWASAQPGGLAAVPIATRVEIVAQAAEALQAAHEAGILHRDMKPANILVRRTRAGSTSAADMPDDIHVLVADFGIGQLVLDHLPAVGTRLGFTHTLSRARDEVLAGSVLYLAPEVAGGGTASVRSDVFSLGIVLWQLLVGDLRAPLDPLDWADRVDDPLLREDVRRCLAGLPERRWASAGELAKSLRSLQARREAAARRALELRALERTAYLRRIARIAGVAVAVVVFVSLLAVYALRQRDMVGRSRGERALTEAVSIGKSDPVAGRRKRGFDLLEIAAATVDRTNAVALRSAAAAIFEMPDLAIQPGHLPTAERPAAPPLSGSFRRPRESARAVSGSGELLAVARELDDGYGAVEVLRLPSGEVLRAIESTRVPRIPVIEPRLLAFEPGDRRLALGGGASSRVVLVAATHEGGALEAFYHPADPVVCAWHPDQPWLAVGCSDGDVRLWNAAAGAEGGQPSGPRRAVRPSAILTGHRGAVEYLAFSPDGRALVSLDRLGYLRVHSLKYSRASGGDAAGIDPVGSFRVEARIEQPHKVEALVYGDELRVLRHGGGMERVLLDLGDAARPIHLRSDATAMVWSESGDKLCVLDLTSVYWIDPSMAAMNSVMDGVNASGMAPRGPDWLVVNRPHLAFLTMTNAGPAWKVHSFRNLRFPTAHESGSVMAVAANARGDVAVYGARRISFLAGTSFVGPDLRVGDGLGRTFANLFWDRPGRILGVVYRDGAGTRVETWSASPEFPPSCERLNPMLLPPGEMVVPAEDGRHLYARGVRGVLRLEPASGRQEIVNSSPEARQTGPFAVDPTGRLLAMVVDSSRLHLLTVPDGTPFATLSVTDGEPVIGLSWQPTGRTLAIASTGGGIRLWRLDRWLGWLGDRQLALPASGGK